MRAHSSVFVDLLHRYIIPVMMHPLSRARALLLPLLLGLAHAWSFVTKEIDELAATESSESSGAALVGLNLSA
eukprot:161076-Hanusia_phi.AAC.1